MSEYSELHREHKENVLARLGRMHQRQKERLMN